MYIETASPQDARAITKVYRGLSRQRPLFLSKKPEEQLR